MRRAAREVCGGRACVHGIGFCRSHRARAARHRTETLGQHRTAHGDPLGGHPHSDVHSLIHFFPFEKHGQENKTTDVQQAR